jgi:hypothetical protein
MINNWGDVPAGHGTPATAWQVGIVTQNGYVGGTLDPVTRNLFWVLQAGPAFTTLSVQLGAGFEYLHLHDGTGLMFGAQLAPATYDIATGQASWTLTPGRIYVLEARGPGGFFF